MIHGLNMLGQSLLGWRYWDLVRALDLLESLDRTTLEMRDAWF